MQNFQRILVLSRSTRNCRKAVRIGISLARMNNAKLYVLHVFHDPFSMEGWNLPVPSFHDEYVKLVENHRKELHDIISKEKSEGIDITEWVRDEKPLEETLKVVSSENIDLLIMLAHEEGRIEHFLFGQTNEAILRKMPCSVLVVKQ